MRPSTTYVLVAFLRLIFPKNVLSIPLHEEYTDNFYLDAHQNHFEEELFRWNYIKDCKYDMCLELKFHCDQDLTTRAYLNRIKGAQCSFRGFFWHKPTSTIAVTSKDCPINEFSELEVYLFFFTLQF